MGWHYEIDDVAFPAELRGKVEALITKHQLDDVLEIMEGSKPYVCQSTSEKVSSNEAEAMDCFLDDMADLLKGTPNDGQLIDFECECEPGLYVLAGGKRHIANPDPITAVISRQIEPGTQHVIRLTCQVIALPEKKVLIVGAKT